MILTIVILSIICLIVGICMGMLFNNYIHANYFTCKARIQKKKPKVKTIEDIVTEKYGISMLWFKYDGISFWTYYSEYKSDLFHGHDESQLKAEIIKSYESSKKAKYPGITNYFCIFKHTTDDKKRLSTLTWDEYPINSNEPDLITAYNQLLEK